MDINNDYKTNWYDGELYARFLDPFTGKPFDRLLKRMIDENSTVIDIGCGTGVTVLTLFLLRLSVKTPAHFV